METLRVLLFIGIAVAAGWLLWTSVDEGLPLTAADWDVRAEGAALIGDAGDRFAYTGGSAVRSIDGSARLRLFANGSADTIRFSVRVTEEIEGVLLPSGETAAGELTLTAQLRHEAQTWFDVVINGESGLGDGRLPQTRASIAGTASFTLLRGVHTLTSDLLGFWSLAHALRREDGSIRQQGLVFSPLLRDKSGFADPERLELTLLLYGEPVDGAARVLLHLVFRDVAVARSPDDV